MDKNAEHFMQEALKEARRAADAGETPVGAVVVHEGEVVGRGHNLVEQSGKATRHAEIVALEDASVRLGRWRLNDASLYVTLEPCPMCIGAILLARFRTLYFGAYDPRQGAVGSVFDLSNHPGLPNKIEVVPELLAEESRTLLQTFFREKR
jgi:tRNA(adenine34) deaminase